MPADPLIRVTALGKAFGARLVLGDVSLAVHPGEAVALLGPNGAGKTTLLKILATLTRPTRGAAAVAGHDCARDAERVRRVIALVAHGTWVYDDLTAVENLRFWATLAGLTPSADALAGALAQVELDRVASVPARTFSTGMKRRLGLARLVLAPPRVLLLDEPFAGLDERARKWFEEHLEAVKARGGALLMATHSLGRELAIAGRIAILAGGRIALDAPHGAVGTEEIRRLYALHTEEAS